MSRARRRSSVAGVVRARASRARCRASASGPYVYRLAAELGLGGFVLNDARGVLLEVEGSARGRRALPRAPGPRGAAAGRARAGQPPRSAGRSAAAGFEIRRKRRRRTCRRAGGARQRHLRRLPGASCSTRATAATATRSSTAPTAGRGSRSCAESPTTVRSTTMAGFEMCARCRAEYEDPGDRRFHAQPNACPDCGPSLALLDADGLPRRRSRDPIAAAAGALRGGAIVAIKGIGGFHLACRADDERAVAALRARKHREDKPFALMAPDLRGRRGAGRPGRARAALLDGPERPIVLARRAGGRASRAVGRARVARARRDAAVLAAAPPAARRSSAATLVMTSGNVSDEPIAYGDADALERLRRDRRPVPGPRPPDRDAHRRLGRPCVAVAGRRAHELPAPLARLRARRHGAARRAPRARCSRAAPS